MTTKVSTDNTPSDQSSAEDHLKTTPVQGRSDGRGYRDALSQSASSSVTMQSAAVNSCSYISNNVQDDTEEGEVTEETVRIPSSQPSTSSPFFEQRRPLTQSASSISNGEFKSNLVFHGTSFNSF